MSRRPRRQSSGATLPQDASLRRRAGLLLHPSCLPGPFPIGDIGPAAHELLDWIVACGMSSWQVLPLGPTGYGDSPYHAHSSFAGNPLLISPEAIVADGLLAPPELEELRPEATPQTDFLKARNFKQRLHRRVWDRVAASLSRELSPRGDFGASDVAAGAIRALPHAVAGASPLSSLSLQWKSFVSDSAVRSWLEEWSLYAALKEMHGGRSWLDWEPDLRDRRRTALESAQRELAAEIEFHAFEQFLFFRQWAALRAAAEARGVELMGDLPIYPALDSADVWAHRSLFRLGRDGRPTKVAGVPPDYFSESGQLWGNPLYRWERLAERGFGWWIARMRWQLRLFHRLRVDHFRGFVAFWEVPASAKTAARGRWQPGPGRALFTALRRALGPLPLVAEDLGEIDESVHGLRRRLDLPGMRVLQFGFAEVDSLHAPHHHPPDVLVYTGTHDNDTSRGWLAAAPEDVRRRALTYLGASEDGFAWAMVRAALTSPAELAVVPLQDLLGLGSEARMNTPARESGNWTWRVRRDQVPGDLPVRLRALIAASARLPAGSTAEGPPASSSPPAV